MRLFVHILTAMVVLVVPAARGQHTSSAAIDVMPGLVLRVKASTLGLADGDPVLLWPNTADLSRSAAAGGGAPTYHENVLNGKAAIRFSRANFDRLDIGGGGLTLNDWTIFVVHQTAGDGCFLTNSSANIQLRIGQDGQNRLTGWDSTQAATGKLLSTPRTAWSTAEYRRDGLLLVFQESGAGRGFGPWFGPATFDQIGAITGSPALDGDIAEILIFARKLTIADEATVYDYLNGEYAIVPSIVPTALVHTPPALPRLYSYLHFQAAANIDYRNLPVDRAHVYVFNEEHVNPDLATFQAAVLTRIPDPAATGYASLDLEMASPGLLPWFALDYWYPPWRPTNREYITGLLNFAHAARPGVKWGVYWHPYYDSIALRSPVYEYAASMAAWFEGYTGPGGLATLLAHCDTLQPEIYPHDLTETPADSNFVAAANVQLCWDINDYYVQPQVAREVFPMIWVQVVPTHLGPGEEGDFLSVADLSQRLIAVRLAGADGIFLGGDADPRFHTPEEWQAWADTTLAQALLMAGFICYPNCDGSTAPPVLNVADFGCFLNRFAAGDPYANCDGSTVPPVVNVLDFSCFINLFAAGCQ
jgi:hypothetical protein